MNTVLSQLKADEIEISIVNIIKKCAKKIRFIFIVALVFAILLPLFKYILDNKEYKENSLNATEYTQQELEAMLTPLEITKVNEYVFLDNQLEYMDNYQKNSMLMKIDHNNVYKTTIQLWIETKGENAEQISTLYRNYCENGGLAEKIEVEIEGLQELILCNQTHVSQDTGVLELAVVSDSNEMCESLMGQIEVALKNYSLELQSKIGEHSLICVQKNSDCGYVEEVYEKQKLFYTSYSEIVTKSSQLKQGLTTSQLLLVQDGGKNTNFSPLEKPSINVVFVLLGFALGCIIAIVWVVVLEILNGKIHSDSEIKKRLDYRHLANICYKPENFINRFVFKNTTVEMQLNDVLSKIISRLGDFDSKEVAIVAAYSKEVDQYIQQLVEELSNKGIKVGVFHNITDVESYEKIKTYKYAVLICEIGFKEVKVLYKEDEIYLDAGVNVLGYVSVSE